MLESDAGPRADSYYIVSDCSDYSAKKKRTWSVFAQPLCCKLTLVVNDYHTGIEGWKYIRFKMGFAGRAAPNDFKRRETGIAGKPIIRWVPEALNPRAWTQPECLRSQLPQAHETHPRRRPMLLSFTSTGQADVTPPQMTPSAGNYPRPPEHRCGRTFSLRPNKRGLHLRAIHPVTHLLHGRDLIRVEVHQAHLARVEARRAHCTAGGSRMSGTELEIQGGNITIHY